MKHLMLILILIFGFSTISLAQIKPKVKKYETEHVCNSDCKDGKHCYRHGEIGHMCSSDDMMSKGTKHKCNSECMKKRHCYTHGEKKHRCCDEPMMMQKDIEKTEEKMMKDEEKKVK